jgi:hypothetical protein
MEPETMKRIAAALLAAFALVAPASAATLYVGHGIDGQDLGLSQDLPVDICLVSGPAALGLTYPVALFENVPFKTFAKIDIDLPAGQYGVEVQLAPSSGCKGTVAISSIFPLSFGETATAFAHLEFGNPTLTKFVNDVRPAGAGKTRLFARHGSAFGDVNILARQNKRNQVYIPGLENGEQEGADIRPGTWRVSIFPAGSFHPAFSASLTLAANTAYFAYAVGTPAKDSFTVLVQDIELK